MSDSANKTTTSFEHAMTHEIYEQPEAIARTLAHYVQDAV